METVIESPAVCPPAYQPPARRIETLEEVMRNESIPIIPYDVVVAHREDERGRVLREHASHEWTGAPFNVALIISLIGMLACATGKQLLGILIFLALSVTIVITRSRTFHSFVHFWEREYAEDARFMWQCEPYEKYVSLTSVQPVPVLVQSNAAKILFLKPSAKISVEYFGLDPLIRADLGHERLYFALW